jgi:predicted O-methyltransferase YrrM
MQERQSISPAAEVQSGGATGNEGMSSARRVARLPAVGTTLISAWRARIALAHVAEEARKAWRWWRASREVTNYTYDLTPRNLEQLAAFLAQASGAELARVQELMRELYADEVLHAHVRRATLASPDLMHADAFPRFGRRIGWYVLVRLFRPRLVVETGVDKGLGACVLCAALLRNAEEGAPGRYIGIDHNPQAGWLLKGPYTQVGSIMWGDSLSELARLTCIDFLLHDSNHSPEFEAREFEVAESRLSDGALVLSDNADVSDALWKFALRTKRRYFYFQEQPRDHFYRGDGIGLTLP